MTMSRAHVGSAGGCFDEAATYRRALAALELQRWRDAREELLELARHLPGLTRYRAMLAYARGQEASASGDDVRAQEEWRRALILDPSLRAAERALAAHSRSSTWIARLFRPS